MAAVIGARGDGRVRQHIHARLCQGGGSQPARASCRPRLQRSRDDRADAQGRQGRRGARHFPGTRVVGLHDRRPAPAIHPPLSRSRRHHPREGRQQVAGARGRGRRADPGRAVRSRLRGGDASRRHPRRRAQDLPAQLSRVLREASVRHVDRRGGRPDHACRRNRAVRRRSLLRSQRCPWLHPRRRDLRGHVGPDPAFDLRRPRRRQHHREPFGFQHHDRQGGRARHAVPVAIGAGIMRLHLRRRRLWRVHDRHRLGRPAGSL